MDQLLKKIESLSLSTFNFVNFGCRVNSAESNLISQLLLNQGLTKTDNNPQLILVNTCAVTKKGEYESLAKIRTLLEKYPKTIIVATGCANLSSLKKNPQVIILENATKELLTDQLKSLYTNHVQDKFTKSKKYILKVQSGCTQGCTYCVVPTRRQQLWSLPIAQSINTVNQAIADGYEHLIITGINLNQYFPGLSNLVSSLLHDTTIKLISFGSIPLNSIDTQLISLYKKYPHRLHPFLHIPLQSGSDRILKLMKRGYDRQKILSVFSDLKQNPTLKFGTDIIVGFPGESPRDFQATSQLCQIIGFSKIHTFRYSPRPNTQATQYYTDSFSTSPEEISRRSQIIRSLALQTAKTR